MANPKEELVEHLFQTVCRKRPELCEPRHIQHVAWDADDTMWKITPFGIASGIGPPFKLIDPDTLEAESPSFTTPVYAPPPTKPLTPTVFKTARPESLSGEWWKTPEEEREDIPPEEEREDIPELYYEELESQEQGGILFAIKELAIKGKTEEEIEDALAEEYGLLTDLEGELTGHIQQAIKTWGKPPPGNPKPGNPNPDKSLEDIAKQLIDSLPEEQRRVIQAASDVTGQQLELVQIPQVVVWKKGKQGKKQKKEKKVEITRTSSRRKITVKLLPTFRDTLVKLKERGITSSVISLNAPGTVSRIIEAFGLADNFIEIKDTWDNKGKVFEDITKKHHIPPCNAMFVDNLNSHVEEVSKKCALGLVIGEGQDVEKPIDIFNFIEGSNG